MEPQQGRVIGVYQNHFVSKVIDLRLLADQPSPSNKALSSQFPRCRQLVRFKLPLLIIAFHTYLSEGHSSQQVHLQIIL